MAGTTNLDEYYIAPFYKTTFEWRQEETEHMLLKASNDLSMGWSTVQMHSGLKWKRIGTQTGLSSKLIKSTYTINRFIDFRYNSVSAGKLLNYALKIQCTFTSPCHHYTSTLIIFIFNQHHQEYRDLDQLICWFTRILLLRIDPRFNDLQ
ncbi:hypothetical protein V1477_021196, partial [Vespula maculifrons]